MRIKNYFSAYLDYLKQKGLADHTVGEHKRFLYGAIAHAKPLFKKRVSKLRLTDVASVIEAGKQHGEYGSQRAVVTFRQFLKFLKQKGIKLPFDYRDIEVPKVSEKIQCVARPENLDKVPFNNKCNLRTRTLLEVLFSTGMRIGEAISLNKDDIDWEKKEAKVKGKNKKEGMVYFSDRSLKWLKLYLEKRKDSHPALFINHYGGRLTTKAARRYLRKWRESWGIEKPITHHSFRRGLATFLMEKGADLKSTQYLLRHKSERTTLKYYVAFNKKRAKKVHQRILAKI